MSFIKPESDYPSHLIKYFDERSHAENFLNGNIQISLIDHYKTIEGYRQDKSENQSAHTYTNNHQKLTISYTHLNPTYILCTSGPNADQQKCKQLLGSTSVIIHNVNEFRGRLKKYWGSLNFSSSNQFYQIEYDKNEEPNFSAEPLVPHGISLRQKNKDYFYEDEYRFIFVCNITTNHQYKEKETLNIGNICDIAEIS